HGLRWTTLRGIKKVTMQVMLVFASMNLKKLATCLWNPEKEKRKLLQLLTLPAKNKTNSPYNSSLRRVCPQPATTIFVVFRWLNSPSIPDIYPVPR
ncbi:transposase, partial [Brevibacillus halotolerans]|uniref:transposase n=1 Tax=Brevibacillus halotolerans TaxID=1507437 RepID=UPI001FEC99A0